MKLQLEGVLVMIKSQQLNSIEKNVKTACFLTLFHQLNTIDKDFKELPIYGIFLILGLL